MGKFERLLISIEKKCRRFSDAQFNKIEPRTTPLGFKLAGNEAMQRGVFEPEETQLVSKLLEKADTFVNVGANVGYYCCLALQKNKPVIAFEPEHENVKLLLKNVAANGWQDNVEIYPIGLSNQAGIANIYGKGTGASLLKGWANMSADIVASIPLSTLDFVVGERLKHRKALVLVDIEGAELNALRGALGLLRQSNRPIWMVEICIHQHQPAGVPVNPNLLSTFSLFWENGYNAYTASTSPRLVAKNELSSIAGGGVDTIGTHNFIFAAKEYDLAAVLG
jgi:FkbM family methyltransferase